MTLQLQLAVNGVPREWHVRCCNTFLSRALGRFASRAAQLNCAWRLHPCRAVHTCFLSQPIDVAFCDAGETIIRMVPMVRPWRCVASRAATSTWEFPGGTMARLALRLGDRLGPCA